MPYVTIPKDLTKVKIKVLFNLTKRQLVCFGIGIIVGVPLFFLTKGTLGSSSASLLMILSMMPAFLFAVFEKNGQPLEVYLRNMVRVLFRSSKQRPYQTNNFYAAVIRQDNLDKEVYRIVRSKADDCREKGSQGSNRKRKKNG